MQCEPVALVRVGSYLLSFGNTFRASLLPRCWPVHHWSYCTEAAVSVCALVSVSRVHLGSISWLHYAFNENITANLCIRVSQLHALVLNV